MAFHVSFLRELKNKATGVDILVPQYEHIPGPFGGSVDYHIIVVTQLFYFKTPTKHKESDIVQFMVSAKNYLTLLHPNTSMHILCVYPFFRQGDFVEKARAPLVGYHFLYPHDLYV